MSANTKEDREGGVGCLLWCGLFLLIVGGMWMWGAQALLIGGAAFIALAIVGMIL